MVVNTHLTFINNQGLEVGYHPDFIEANAIISNLTGDYVYSNYVEAIQPFFKKNACELCHSANMASTLGGGLDLTTFDGLLNGGNHGAAIIPGDSENSLLIQILNGKSSIASFEDMNIAEPEIDGKEIEWIKNWIEQGALETCIDIDEDGVCDYRDDCILQECGCNQAIPDGACDCEGNIDYGCGCGENGPSGCDNACGSTLALDECGICGGPGAIPGCGCDDIPVGFCDCSGNIDLGCGCGEVGPSGCNDMCGSTLAFDICGECNGNGCYNQDCTQYPQNLYDCDGNCAIVGDEKIEGVCDGELSIDNNILPEEFYIRNIYPNPFNPVLHIDFNLKTAGMSQIDILDISGAHIETLYGGFLHSGSHEFGWNAESMPSGVYLVFLKFGDMSLTEKVVLLK